MTPILSFVSRALLPYQYPSPDFPYAGSGWMVYASEALAMADTIARAVSIEVMHGIPRSTAARRISSPYRIYLSAGLGVFTTPSTMPSKITSKISGLPRPGGQGDSGWTGNPASGGRAGYSVHYLN